MKTIPYNENYFVDKEGNVYSKTGRKLKCSTNGLGYRQLFTYKDGKFDKSYCIHRLVYETFVGQIPDDMEIDHINRNRSDNRLENLRVLSHKDNLAHRDCAYDKHTTEWNKNISIGMKKCWEKKRISANL